MKNSALTKHLEQLCAGRVKILGKQSQRGRKSVAQHRCSDDLHSRPRYKSLATVPGRSHGTRVRAISEVRILRQRQAEITIIEKEHEIVLNELFQRRVDPGGAVELSGDFFSASCIATVFVERSVRVGISMETRGAVACVIDRNSSPCLAIAKIGSLTLAPTLLPGLYCFEYLLVLRIVESVSHLVFKVIGNALQVESIFWEQEVIARRRD